MANNQNLCADIRRGQHKRAEYRDSFKFYASKKELEHGDKFREAGCSKDMKVGDVVKL